MVWGAVQSNSRTKRIVNNCPLYITGLLLTFFYTLLYRKIYIDTCYLFVGLLENFQRFWLNLWQFRDWYSVMCQRHRHRYSVMCQRHYRICFIFLFLKSCIMWLNAVPCSNAYSSHGEHCFSKQNLSYTVWLTC